MTRTARLLLAALLAGGIPSAAGASDPADAARPACTQVEGVLGLRAGGGAGAATPSTPRGRSRSAMARGER